MGRSVSYPSGAIVAFRLLDEDANDDLDWTYEYLVDEVVSSATTAFPSLEPFEGWRGREDRILLRNAFADCGISTYCGLAAIWLAQVAPRFERLFGELRMIGRFSNGEGIFEQCSSCI